MDFACFRSATSYFTRVVTTRNAKVSYVSIDLDRHFHLDSYSFEDFGKHRILRTFAFLGPKVMNISMFSVRSCILPRVAPQSYFESNFSRILRSDWRILSAPRDPSGHIWFHFGHPGEHFVVILRISLLIELIFHSKLAFSTIGSHVDRFSTRFFY